MTRRTHILCGRRMRWCSRHIVFSVLVIEICILVIYVLTDHQHSAWKLLINLGYGDSTTDNKNGSAYRSFFDNVTMVFKGNVSLSNIKQQFSGLYLTRRKGGANAKGVYTGGNSPIGISNSKPNNGDSNKIDQMAGRYIKDSDNRSVNVGQSIDFGPTSGEVRTMGDHFLVCPKPYGRIGNMLFQYAASVGIAHELHYKHIIDPDHTLLEYFEIKNSHPWEIENKMTIREEHWINDTWRVNETTYLSHNLTLFGYFQEWKYFVNFSDEIRASLSLKPTYIERARTFLKHNVPGLKYRIGIHVRRGDFLSEISIGEGRVVADKTYIDKAMDYFRQNYANDVCFIVLSDDMKWCKQNIQGDDVIFSKFTKPILDLAIMSMCDHMIITVGSFGWWGGWLSGGTVIFLEDYPRPGSELYQTFVKEDYYLPDWIGMSNS